MTNEVLEYLDLEALRTLRDEFMDVQDGYEDLSKGWRVMHEALMAIGRQIDLRA